MKKLFEKILEWLRFLFKQEPEPVEIIEAESGETEEETTEEIETNDMEENNTVNSYKLRILLDNGHASSTPGKRSPKEEGVDQFFEYEFNRDIVRRIAEKLSGLGVQYEILVPEVDEDVPLMKRAERANKFCDEYGVDKCFFLSVHANAAGNGSSWTKANGWSCYTSRGYTTSDDFAEIFMNEAAEILIPMGRNIRKYSQSKQSWEDNFTVLAKTKCPAVLTENLFYDNKGDLQFLRSEEGREALAQIHVNAILKIEAQA